MSFRETTPQQHHFEYNWVDGAERLEKYRPGGYHPVMIGDHLHQRYRIVDKLGFGGYSTVWLAQDTRENCYVAVKIGVADSRLEETKVLRVLSSPSKSPYLPSSMPSHCGRDAIPLILDEFEVHGPNGTHPCYTTAPAQCNLREVSFSDLFPIEVSRALCFKLTMALAYMHAQGYAHGDVNLSNVLIKAPIDIDGLSIEQLYEKYGRPETVSISRRDGKVCLPPNVPREAVLPLYMGKKARDFTLSDVDLLLTDFGEAFAPGSQVRFGDDCRTPLGTRPPEALLDPLAPLSYSSDIWSLAVTIWEILGMRAVFSNEFVTDDILISEHVNVLGPIPSEWWKNWRNRDQFFDEEGNTKEGKGAAPPIETAFEKYVQKYRREDEMVAFSKEETAAILDLMRRMLSFRPEQRPTAEEILRSDWMVTWARPDFDRSLQQQNEVS